MDSLSGTNSLIPLPGFHHLSGRSFPVPEVGLRRFGIFESDLGIDFGARNRAALVTRLLSQCTFDIEGGSSDGFYREITAGKRIECLLFLAAGGPDARLSFPFKCGGCGEEIELELTLAEISAIQNEADGAETISIDIAGATIDLRKPCGRDQEEWGEMVYLDEMEAAEAMIGTLAVDTKLLGKLDAEKLGSIEETMDEADPLINFTCMVGCGECGENNAFPLDLMESALAMLSRAQKQLVVLVHKLAVHYHWNEKDIFAVPHSRRMQYLDLIAAGRN